MAPAINSDGLTLIARKRLHDGPVTSVAFAPDGKTVASTDTLGRVLVSMATDLAPVHSLEAATGAGVQNCAYSACFSPDGRYLAVGSEDQTIWIWRTDDGRPIKRVRGHRDAVDFLSFLPDAKGGISFDRQGVGLAWSVQGERRELIPDRRMRKAVLTPDGDLLVWSDGARTVCGPPTQEAPTATLGGFADALAVTQDGELVAKGASANCVEVWTARLGTRKWAGPPLPGRVQALAFRPDGESLVSLAGGALSVWDVRSGDEVARFRARADDGSNRMALAQDGQTLVVGNRRGVLTVLHLPK
jgi:WD40 repeat protein